MIYACITACAVEQSVSHPVTRVLRDELFVFFIFPFMPSCTKSIASAAQKIDGQVPALISKGCCKGWSAKPEAACSVVFR